MPEDSDFYKNIIDNLYDGVYFVDRERVITYWNKGAERITGYKAKEVMGRACAHNILIHVDGAGQPHRPSRDERAVRRQATGAACGHSVRDGRDSPR